MVIWIIGLSGSGKSTLAERVVGIARARGRPTVLLDGDEVREVFAGDLGHSLADRRINSDRISRLCRLLDSQGFNVVCPILSIFPESRDWCRKNLSAYCEVFVDCPIEALKVRDSKGIYSAFSRGELRNVAGLDLAFPPPSKPDFVINNTGTLDQLLRHAHELGDLL